jgi:hypothetical protein
MSAVSIVGSLGIPAVVAAAITVGGGAFLTYRYGLRKLRDEYEMEQQRELRKLMGEYTGRMLEAAVDWDRRMMQLYKYWTKPDENAPPQDGDEDDPDIGWHMMCPGRGARRQNDGPHGLSGNSPVAGTGSKGNGSREPDAIQNSTSTCQ